jgi:hypothetical protein
LLKAVLFQKKLGNIKRLCCQCFLLSIISLHLSAYWHQSRQDCSFSGLPTSLLHVSHTPVSSSLQISTLPPQLGHGKYAGTGRRNFFMPGHVSALELVNYSSLHGNLIKRFFLPLCLLFLASKEYSFPKVLELLGRGDLSRSSMEPPC